MLNYAVKSLMLNHAVMGLGIMTHIKEERTSHIK